MIPLYLTDRAFRSSTLAPHLGHTLELVADRRVTCVSQFLRMFNALSAVL